MTDIQSTAVLEILRSVSQRYRDTARAHIASEKTNDGYTTDLDLWIDKHLAVELKNILDIDYISEESIEEVTSADASEEDFWLVDPLDGTMNAIIGFPYFSTSISLVSNNRIQYAFVVNLPNGDIYHAKRGNGLMKNGAPVHRATRTNKTIFSTGFAHDRRLHERQLDTMSTLLRYVDDFRRLASPCLDLCLVAEGILSGCAEYLKSWDLAAGTLFLDEVGVPHNHSGLFYLPSLRDQFEFVAADRSLMPLILEALDSQQ